MTEKAVADYLGVSDRTLRNQKKNGFELEMTPSGEIDVVGSAHAFVKHQSQLIRQLSAQKGRGNSGNSSADDPETESGKNWKEEKEKQAAIKMLMANRKARGELIPVEAMIELYNAPLTLVRSKLLSLSNELQKRVQLDPAAVKAIDDIVRDALQRLEEKGADELQDVIQKVIERYSEYYSAAEEDGDYSLVEGE